MPTVGVHLPILTGEAGMLGFLRHRTTGALLNVGGDVLVETEDDDEEPTGFFEMEVEEPASGVHSFTATMGGGVVYQGWVNMSFDPAIVDDDAQINPAGSGGGGGTGARTVTITVTDGVSPLEAARVRVTQGAESFVQATNVSGLATFNVDDATWQVAITKAGYSFAGAALVVDGDEAATYSMTLVAITPPANPGLSAIEVLCLDSTGQQEVGVDVDIRIVAVPNGSQNIAFRGTKQTATSDGGGIARFEVVQGSTCEWKRGLADVWQRVSVDADGVTNVTSVIGSP